MASCILVEQQMISASTLLVELRMAKEESVVAEAVKHYVVVLVVVDGYAHVNLISPASVPFLEIGNTT